MSEVENHFTVFVRLPLNRWSFVDPPPVAWSASKERALWDLMSRQSKGNEIDWKALAERFEVTQPFLLQQAAWLHERQLSQIRAQMRRVGTTRQSTTPSPVPGSASGSVMGGYAMKRGGSGGSRAPSRLSVQAKDIAGFKSDNSAPGTPNRTRGPQPPRIGASMVTSHTRNTSTSEAPVTSRPISRQPSKGSHLPQHQIDGCTSSQQQQLPRIPVSPVTQRQSSDSDDATAPAAGPTRRPNPAASRFRSLTARKPQVAQQTAVSDEDEDEEDSSPFLPFASATANPETGSGEPLDPGAPLRGGSGSPAHAHRPKSPRQGTMERVTTVAPRSQPKVQHPTSPSSSTSSGPAAEPNRSAKLQQPDSTTKSRPGQSRPPGPLSPRRAAELQAAGLSPRRRPGGHGREGSDGTPSMGSSFSDLDDASVTQSALEEALMSNMGHGNGNGGMASRMSTISQALRSRYFEPQARSGR